MKTTNSSVGQGLAPAVKKALSLFLSLIMLFTITTGIEFSSFADTSGDYEYELLDDGTAEITGYMGSATDLIIPSTLDGCAVASIGAWAFYDCSSLTSVTIPNSVTSIRSGAFYDCSSLASITIPNSVTSIGDDAFYDCSNLTSVTIGNSVTSIGDGAFSGCENLISLTMPCSADFCYDFYNLENLEKVTLTKGTGIMNDSVLESTSVKEVILENGITNISSWAFYDCSSLTSVTIPNSVTSIGDAAFSECSSLTSVTIPNSVTSIGYRAFNDCNSLTSVTIPNSVTSIESEAFSNTPYFDNILRNFTGFNNNISLDIKESEYDSFDFSSYVLNKLENKCDELGVNSLVMTSAVGLIYLDYSDIHKLHVHFNNGSLDDITLNISYNNTNNYNSKDKEYIDKKLSNAKCPNYFEDDLDYATRVGPLEFMKEYYSNLINDDSVYVCVDSYAGEYMPLSSCVSDGTFIRIFKNDILYYSEILSGAYYSIPIIYIPNDVKDSGIIQYLEKELNSYLDKSEYYKDWKIKSITKGASIRNWKNGNEYYVNVVDGYTIKYDNVYSTDDYIIVRRKSPSQAECNHKYKTTTTKATTSKNGSIVQKCTVCNVSKKTTIYYPKTISLSTTSYTYDGKVKKPSVTVKDSNGNKIASSNYTVTYQSGRKNVGKYTVTIKFKGNYSGTVKKTFTIKPKATTISKVTAAKKAFTVKWKKQATQTTGYEIQYATDSKFTKNKKTVTVNKNSATSKKITKLSAKKKYYVRVRAYKTVKVNGKSTKIYSSWSKAKTVKTK